MQTIAHMAGLLVFNSERTIQIKNLERPLLPLLRRCKAVDYNWVDFAY